MSTPRFGFHSGMVGNDRLAIRFTHTEVIIGKEATGLETEIPKFTGTPENTLNRRKAHRPGILPLFPGFMLEKCHFFGNNSQVLPQ